MVKEESIRASIKIIREAYVDKDLANKTADELEKYLDSDVGKARLLLEDPGTLMWDLNAIIASVTHDLHFGYANPYATSSGSSGSNNGVIRAGPHYIKLYKLDYLGDESVRARFSKVFEQVQDPIILDLRGCVGGDAEAVYFVLCHFLPDGTELFEIQSRMSEPRMFKAASTASVYETFNKIKKYTGRVKVLVDSGTYSGGEILAKTLQSLKRAKVYGTNTPGAFNVTKHIRFDDITLHLPWGKFIDAGTGKDYDKIGVIPDFTPTSKEYIETIFSEVSEHTFNSF